MQHFFPVPTGSPIEAFRDLAPRYPVFELQALDKAATGTGVLCNEKGRRGHPSST
jgi:hypothetical protein